MKSDLEKKVISTLKGRISKALSNASVLNETERVELEVIFQEIDNLILYKGVSLKTMKEKFQKKLQDAVVALKKSKKSYLKNHIIPLMNKISNGTWKEEDTKDNG